MSRTLLSWTVILALVLLACSPAAAAPLVVRPGVTPSFAIATTTAATPQTVSCTAPCQCLFRSEAIAQWGSDGFSQCAELPCAVVASAAAAPQEKFCFRQKPPATIITASATTPVSVMTLQQVVCPVGSTPCSSGCFDLQVNRNNCGSCGHACTVSQQCEKGACVPKISTATTADPCLLQGKVTCGGTCIDIHGSDAKNCGGCGWQCPAGLSCDGGECVMVCPAGFADCQYKCVDVQNDPENCGSCGNACPARQACSKGKCTPLCSFKPSDFASFSWADWQGRNWMTVPKGQGACGSCWAEAPTGITEAMHNIELGYKSDIDLSEQWLVSACAGDMGACTGGNNEAALKSLKTDGVPEEVVLPYTSASCGMHYDPPDSKNIVCNADCNQGSPNLHCSTPNTCKPSVLAPDRLWKVNDYYRVSYDYGWTLSDEFDAIKKRILCDGPISACSGHWWHCIDIVGWQGTQYSANGGWIIRNSWGATWNGNGYAVIPYGDPYSGPDNDYGDLIRDAWAVKGVYANA